MEQQRDIDPVETREWRDALASVIAIEGAQRAGFLLEALREEAQRHGAPVPFSANTPYINTIRPEEEARHPGDRAIEHRIRSLVRWNALATVLRANKEFLRARRSYRELPIRRAAVRYRLHAFLARRDGAARRRSRVSAGPFLAGLLRARLHGRTDQRATVC